MPVPEIDLRRIKKWCTQETSPLHADQLRVEADVTATAVTIVETRPPWDDPTGDWTRFPIARLRYTATTGEWTSTGGTDTSGSTATTEHHHHYRCRLC